RGFRMGDKKGFRKLVVLTLSPTEFFVEGEGAESDVRKVVENVLPNIDFTLSALKDARSAPMQSRLQPPHREIMENLHSEKPGPLKAYRVEFETRPPLGGGTELSKEELENVAGGVGPLGSRLPPKISPKAQLDLTSQARTAGPVKTTQIAKALAFAPDIKLISRPLLNPRGPVSVTVGVGIAGKF